MGCEAMAVRAVKTWLPEAFPQPALPPKIKITFGSERLRKCKRMHELFLLIQLALYLKITLTLV